MSATDLPSTAMSHAKAYGLLFVVTVLWAGNFPLGKLGLAELGPITLTAARALIAAPLLLLAARLSHGPFPVFTRRDYRTYGRRTGGKLQAYRLDFGADASS